MSNDCSELGRREAEIFSDGGMEKGRSFGHIEVYERLLIAVLQELCLGKVIVNSVFGSFRCDGDFVECEVWQSGRGPAVDPAGAIYFETGNGSFDGKRDFGTSLIKLAVGKQGFMVDDYFTPHDYEALNARDADLGSTGPMLIPGTSLLIGGSKKGFLYLFDTRKLGRLTPDDAGVLQLIENNGGRLLAGPAYWGGAASGTVYLWCEADVVKGARVE